MSLLLEALKKAELAKQGTTPAGEETPFEAIQIEPRPPRPFGEHEPEPQAPREAFGEVSRARNAPFEDAAYAAAMPEPSQAETGPAAAPSPFDSPPPVSSRSEPEERPYAEPEPVRADASAAQEREAARQMFEAKEIEYNPQRNFYIVIGVLVAAGAGYAGYVWWQLQPKAYFPRPVAESAAPSQAPVPSAAPAVQAPAAAAAPPLAPPPLVPAAPESKPAQPAVTASAAKLPAGGETVFRRQVPTAPPASALAGRASAQDRARAPRDAAASIAIKPSTLGVDPVIEGAYEAYQRGDLAGAREGYQQTLRRDPLNRDAQLGMAAIDVRGRNFDTAEARYLRLLELDPRDASAQAGLMSLRGQIDPVQSESRLKTLIASNPDSPYLYFALGNQYAQQARWPDAQAAYFKAYTGEPENADFAFNVAVSLDQLRKSALALEYYRRAIALSAGGPAGFDRAQAAARVRQLERP